MLLVIYISLIIFLTITIYHLLYKDEVVGLKLHPGSVLIIGMVSPIWVDAHWSICVEYCSTVRSCVMAPV